MSMNYRPFDTNITFDIRSNGRQLHVSVTNDVLINRFGAKQDTPGIAKALAKYASVFAWIAEAMASSGGRNVASIDRFSFDDARSCSLTVGAILKAQDPLRFSRVENVALECLRDTTADDKDGSLNIASAIGLFIVRSSECLSPATSQVELLGAEAWIFYALFRSLDKCE